MTDQFNWDVPPLDSADERLVEAYKTCGRTVDDLPYTPEFETLIRLLGVDDTLESRHMVYKRLLGLRKRGRLPGVGRFASY